ncbi:DNA glycosylase [Laetiporus sulphureus 93-53]|uniref:DNA-(apurinic or apyrimidinic site) lyase n=1 Tax=Laetiporus sulphureus 93-53 TaxID=1314785 RepID=A0A165G0N2_9APHY|nr:DNA glycosylase [Laetiporus sulphureus 93-53]KZT09672.1 DNA glycosylase [Laetiporus sulphureus 93-53]
MACMIPTGFRALPLSITQLSLAAVLQCGQSFRWNVFPLFSDGAFQDNLFPTHEYRLCLRDRVVCLRQTPDILFYRSVLPGPPPLPSEDVLREQETLAWLRDYFQLDVDLIELYEQWGKRDPVFRNCRERFAGIRMLRQEPFENLISFICSSNNNIVRITKMVKTLCKHYSPALLSLPPPTDAECSSASDASLEVESYHPFPPPSILAASDISATLRTLGFGYRAEFVQKTAKMLVDAHASEQLGHASLEPAEKWLCTLRQMSTSEAREELLKFMGVGRKVADCVLLMSLDKKEVIPVDTHVHQIAVKHYGISSSSKAKGNMTSKLYDEVSSKLAAVWGDYAGWAHSVLFTSDLKAFASYGLPSPSQSPSVKERTPKKSCRSEIVSGLATPPATPTPQSSSSKRKRAIIKASSKDGELDLLPSVNDGLNMADRVKRRRRAAVTKAAEISVVA